MECENELHDKRATLLEFEETSTGASSDINDGGNDAWCVKDTKEMDLEEASIPLFEVMPGAAEWVKSSLEAEMSCAVVSHLDLDQVEMSLKQANVLDLIRCDKCVTASNVHRRDQGQSSGASLCLERKPDHLLFSIQVPFASDAANKVEMRSVSIIGQFPRCELLTADSAPSSFTDPTARNMRRLFDQPQMDAQRAEPDKTQKTKTRFFWDNDTQMHE